LRRPTDSLEVEVVEAIDGPIQAGYHSGGRKGGAVAKSIEGVLENVNRSIRAELAKVSIEDLLTRRGTRWPRKLS
jgi:DNA-binding IscR family transcriptional regulator